MDSLPARIALVYDRVNKWGGAERVLLALNEMFPQAPLYTAVYNQKKAVWAEVFPAVIPTFLQHFPYAQSKHELYPWLTPLAFESLNFDDYDLVISVTSADAKGIITKPHTFHLCYCLTPTRYLWSHVQEYGTYKFGPLFDYLKRWDLVASRRPDAYISISKTVHHRLKSYYGLDSQIVYPPVNTNQGPVSNENLVTKNYFLWVGRLVTYKRAQIIVETFNELKLPLVVIGLGHLADKLKRIALDNVFLIGSQSEEALSQYYRNAQGLVFWHEEDFGIVPVEAMAHGTPVIGLNQGGVSETVVHGQTGLLVDNSIQELKNAIVNFTRSDFDSQTLITHAQKFSKARFQQQFYRSLVRAYSSWRRGNQALASIAR